MEALEKVKIDSKKEFDACNISGIEFNKHKNYRKAVVKLERDRIVFKKAKSEGKPLNYLKNINPVPFYISGC